jgi:hypothetical protein
MFEAKTVRYQAYLVTDIRCPHPCNESLQNMWSHRKKVQKICKNLKMQW